MIHFTAMSRSFQIWSSALQPDKGEGREIVTAHLAAAWSTERSLMKVCLLQPHFSHTSNSLRGKLANQVQNYGFSIASFSIPAKKNQVRISPPIFLYFSAMT